MKDKALGQEVLGRWVPFPRGVGFGAKELHRSPRRCLILQHFLGTPYLCRDAWPPKGGQNQGLINLSLPWVTALVCQGRSASFQGYIQTDVRI